MPEISNILTAVEKRDRLLGNNKILGLISKTIDSGFYENVVSTTEDGRLSVKMDKAFGYLDLAIGSKDYAGMRDLDNVGLQIFNLYAEQGIRYATDMAICYVLFHTTGNERHIDDLDEQSGTDLLDKPFYVSFNSIKKHLGDNFDYNNIKRAYERLRKKGILIEEDLQHNQDVKDKYDRAVHEKRKITHHTKQLDRYSVVLHKLVEYCRELDLTDAQKKKLKNTLGYSYSLQNILMYNPLYVRCSVDYDQYILFKK